MMTTSIMQNANLARVGRASSALWKYSSIDMLLVPKTPYFGNMNCTWTRICQFGPSSGETTL
jgi:hypothetical protein